MKRADSARRGFTLVEVMIVVATIALLAVIAIPNYVRARSQSQSSACINNLRKIDDASQEWAMENRQSATAAVTFGDIQPYLKGAVVCPSSGEAATFAESYGLTTVSNKPTCKIVPVAHVLPTDSASQVTHPVAP
jgi:prepilin-type N-terminal cleavage/methylation domain-containing protein